MRRVNKPTSVLLNNKDEPLAVQWRNKMCAVIDIVDGWRVGALWWQGQHLASAWLLELDCGVTIELVCCDDVWVVERVMD